MAASNHRHHVLLVTFPAQGHINPSLQFAKRLSNLGVHVTFLTSFSTIRRLSSPPPAAANIDFLSFSDGYEDGFSSAVDVPDFMSSLRTHGSAAVEAAITAATQKHGRPFSRVIYTLLVPWAGQVARRLHVPVTLLWIQPATLFAIYYYYFNSDYFDAFKTSSHQEHDIIIELPGLPPFSPADLPSFLLPTNPSIYDFALPTLEENFKILDSPATVLVNTFDELEADAINAIDDNGKYKLAAIGPLIPSAFLDQKDPSDTSFGGDLIHNNSSEEYVKWLDSKEKSSVIYVAFGSYSELARVQMEEIGKGLIKSGKPFLWVIRGAEKSEKADEIFGGSSSRREELEKVGKIVNWCNQLEVLSHPSVGCFFTHCGWNSTLESLVFGVPMVGFPQWTDQCTNAKLVQDYWRSGVRVDVKGGVVGGDEIERCLEVVMGGGGERGEEMRRQGEKWKRLAKEAMDENGSSNVNLKIFVDQL